MAIHTQLTVKCRALPLLLVQLHSPAAQRKGGLALTVYRNCDSTLCFALHEIPPWRLNGLNTRTLQRDTHSTPQFVHKSTCTNLREPTDIRARLQANIATLDKSRMDSYLGGSRTEMVAMRRCRCVYIHISMILPCCLVVHSGVPFPKPTVLVRHNHPYLRPTPNRRRRNLIRKLNQTYQWLYKMAA